MILVTACLKTWNKKAQNFLFFLLLDGAKANRCGAEKQTG
jgi:hypothetical protein